MDLCLGLLNRRIAAHLEHDELHTVGEEVAAESNVDGRFDAIARQDPEFYACVAEELD
jgi:hypothetical protein